MASQSLWSYGRRVGYQNSKTQSKNVVHSPLGGRARPSNAVRGQTSRKVAGSRR
jgi:hypothetical protein